MSLKQSHTQYGHICTNKTKSKCKTWQTHNRTNAHGSTNLSHLFTLLDTLAAQDSFKGKEDI